MFPQSNNIKLNTVNEESSGIKDSFLFDFNKGDFVLKDGKTQKASGLDSLKMWIGMNVKVVKDRFKVYEGTEFGTYFEDLIGGTYPQDYVEKEIENELNEALLRHDSIQSLSGWSFNFSGSSLIVSFSVNSTFGTFDQEEVI